MLSWYLFCFNTCFILAFSLLKSSVMIEVALSKKDNTYFAACKVIRIAVKILVSVAYFLYTNSEIFT